MKNRENVISFLLIKKKKKESNRNVFLVNCHYGNQ